MIEYRRTDTIEEAHALGRKAAGLGVPLLAVPATYSRRQALAWVRGWRSLIA